MRENDGLMIPDLGNMSRRDFLQSALSLVATRVLGFDRIANYLESDDVRQIDVPPSLMLHSGDIKHNFILPLIEKIKANGYETLTYHEWGDRASRGDLPERPIIISVDDLCMAKGVPSFPYFRQAFELFNEADMKIVFGINTRQEMPQDSSRWSEVYGWAKKGHELATHTSYHSNFSSDDSSPRSDFSQHNYDVEIIDSARMIEQQMGKRGLDYQVRSLILPFGSGFSYSLPKQEIDPAIVRACRSTNIQYVVGIIGGRKVELPQITSEEVDSLIYVGRTPPAYNSERQPLADRTLNYFINWN